MFKTIINFIAGITFAVCMLAGSALLCMIVYKVWTTL